jgi:Tol biopolymer transport system component
VTRPLIARTFDESPRWSPDGHTLAYVHHTGLGDAELRVTPGTGPGRTIAHHLAARETSEPQFDWSPDSRAIAYISTRGTLVTVRTDDARASTIAIGARSDPAWSPDGSTIALTTPAGQIALVGADGSGSPLTPPPGAARAPAWSPDGTRLAYIADPERGYQRAGSPTFWTFATGEALPLWTVPPTSPMRATRVSFSRDGTRALVRYSDGSDFDNEIIDGIPGTAGNPIGSGAIGATGVWSPDNAFVVLADRGIYVARFEVDFLFISPTPGPNQAFAPRVAIRYATDPSWQPLPAG